MHTDRIRSVDPEKTTGTTRALFESVQSQLGMVPNIVRIMGNSQAVLKSYLMSSEALKECTISAALSEQIALTVAYINQCEYCTAVHTFIARSVLQLDVETVQLARTGKSGKSRAQAALTFVADLMENKGKASEQSLQSLKNAGFNDEQITEIIAQTAYNIFTNFIAGTAQTAIDFPIVMEDNLKTAVSVSTTKKKN